MKVRPVKLKVRIKATVMREFVITIPRISMRGMIYSEATNKFLDWAPTQKGLSFYNPEVVAWEIIKNNDR